MTRRRSSGMSAWSALFLLFNVLHIAAAGCRNLAQPDSLYEFPAGFSAAPGSSVSIACRRGSRKGVITIVTCQASGLWSALPDCKGDVRHASKLVRQGAQPSNLIDSHGHDKTLVLYGPIRTVSMPESVTYEELPTEPSDSHLSSGAIAGIVCGCAILCVDIAIIVHVWKKRNDSDRLHITSGIDKSSSQHAITVTPSSSTHNMSTLSPSTTSMSATLKPHF